MKPPVILVLLAEVVSSFQVIHCRENQLSLNAKITDGFLLGKALFALNVRPIRRKDMLSDEKRLELIRAHGTGGWQTVADMDRFARAVAEAAVQAEREGQEPVAKRCHACREVGMIHCCDPAHCNGPWSDKAEEMRLVETVTKAILFQDSGSSEGWEENSDLGEAAIAAYRKATPPAAVPEGWKLSVFSLTEAARCLGVAQERNDSASIDHWSRESQKYEREMLAASQPEAKS